MNKRHLVFSRTSGMILLMVLIGFSACKNKKKAADVSDTDAEKDKIEEEIAAYDEEDEREAVKEPSRTQKLHNYFQAIANASSAQSANGTISEALTLFSSPDAPVLIVIYNANGTTDYDEPTTIKRYLEYLKDTKNNSAMVEEMVMDDYGKIKELVLKK